jgi:hypothetical protein
LSSAMSHGRGREVVFVLGNRTNVVTLVGSVG